jgi:hypothetical protein
MRSRLSVYDLMLVNFLPSILHIYKVSQNYVNTNGLWYHLFPAKCVSGL